MKNTEKNFYDKKDDNIILACLRRNPDNLTEAFRQAKEELLEKSGKVATVNQISSRYYSYVKPHYIEKQEGDSGPLGNLVSGRGTGSIRLQIILDLAKELPEEDLKVLIKESFDHLSA